MSKNKLNLKKKDMSLLDLSLEELTSMDAHMDETGDILDFNKFMNCESFFNNSILSTSEIKEINNFVKQTTKKS